ncbi:MAG: CsgG/HfaB family protein [Candidatus Omnitrophica bacterium]|nr:CsgG/HfaB family protein [Candidatus Omnitrophota bacterium]MDD5592182.1 CsgG/HfaB family protein [Candidatus Omnitrophota bacterium]
MRKLLLIAGCVIFIAGLMGCALIHRKAALNNAGAAPLPSYSGPKARIAVADFEVKAAKATAEAGLGLREMLVMALANSNRFSVVERQESGADLIISAAVTEFEPEASGGRAGIGGGGGAGSGALGGLLGGASNKAHMVLDIRIVDLPTSKVLAATRVQSQASDIAGGVMSGFFGNWGLGAGLSGYANTPMEKTIRICLIEAVRYISQTIPENYYKY